MDLIGSYHAMGYTVEAYFPEQDAPDAWTLWVIRDDRVVGKFTTRIVVDSVHGMDHITMQRLEVAAEIAVMEVTQWEFAGNVREDDITFRSAGNGNGRAAERQALPRPKPEHADVVTVD